MYIYIYISYIKNIYPKMGMWYLWLTSEYQTWKLTSEYQTWKLQSLTKMVLGSCHALYSSLGAVFGTVMAIDSKHHRLVTPFSTNTDTLRLEPLWTWTWLYNHGTAWNPMEQLDFCGIEGTLCRPPARSLLSTLALKGQPRGGKLKPQTQERVRPRGNTQRTQEIQQDPAWSSYCIYRVLLKWAVWF